MQGAIIGLGGCAIKAHVPGWKERSDFKIVAGIDPRSESHSGFLDLVPEASGYRSLQDCLSKHRIDFVDICAPPRTHFHLVREALDRGLNVLCEKPLAVSVDDLESLETYAAQSSKTILPVLRWRFAPICLKVESLIREKAIGEVHHVQWYAVRNGPSETLLEKHRNGQLDTQKSGEGVLLDQGWHVFYLLFKWFGRIPKNISASLENRQYEDLPVEDTAKIKLEFDSNRGSSNTAELFLTWASRIRKNSGVIEGSEGRILVEDDTLTLSRKGGPDETYRFDRPLSSDGYHPEWFGPVIDEFMMEMREPNQKGINLRTAKICLKLVDYSKESNEKGQQVSVK